MAHFIVVTAHLTLDGSLYYITLNWITGRGNLEKVCKTSTLIVISRWCCWSYWSTWSNRSELSGSLSGFVDYTDGWQWNLGGVPKPATKRIFVPDKYISLSNLISEAQGRPSVSPYWKYGEFMAIHKVQLQIPKYNYLYSPRFLSSCELVDELFLS